MRRLVGTFVALTAVCGFLMVTSDGPELGHGEVSELGGLDVAKRAGSFEPVTADLWDSHSVGIPEWLLPEEDR